ncbi:phosphomevalonate kinase isoform X2 [Nilaparvata lugens]|nr:phosphomevalonate kinase isoform X2 [Nilaparvata lugens]XP_039279243.1 phosphomevalonate kinase isoform X2 [Nilaparvata lugens]
MPENAAMVRLSAPIKHHWSRENNLDVEQLLGSGDYKENHRKAMVEWSEQIRAKDYGYFCRAAVRMIDDAHEKKIWIVSDTRRRTDLKWFRDNYDKNSIKTIRIVSSDDVRQKRGWTFVDGVDNAETECDLDSVEEWDMIFTNNNNEQEFEVQMSSLIEMCSL